jgi:hypothetical protein
MMIFYTCDVSSPLSCAIEKKYRMQESELSIALEDPSLPHRHRHLFCLVSHNIRERSEFLNQFFRHLHAVGFSFERGKMILNILKISNIKISTTMLEIIDHRLFFSKT